MWACNVKLNWLQAGLVPIAYVGMGDSGVGCFTTGTDVTLGRVSAPAPGCRSTSCDNVLLSVAKRWLSAFQHSLISLCNVTLLQMHAKLHISIPR